MVSFCTIIYFILQLLNIYQYVLIAYAISTWFNNRELTRFLYRFCRPLLEPIEQLLPGQLKMFSVMVAFLILMGVQYYAGTIVCGF